MGIDTDGEMSAFLYLVRVGQGAGFRGLWQIDTMKFENAPPFAVEYFTAFLKLELYYEFLVDSAVVYSNYSFADYEEVCWQTDLKDTDILFAKVDDWTVKYTDPHTSEVVTINSDFEGNITYSSSNPQHDTYTYYVNSDQCPNYGEPDWLYTFYFGEDFDLYKKRAVVHMDNPFNFNK